MFVVLVLWVVGLLASQLRIAKASSYGAFKLLGCFYPHVQPTNNFQKASRAQIKLIKSNFNEFIKLCTK